MSLIRPLGQSPVSPLARALTEVRGGFKPVNVAGLMFWHEPADLSSLFQDAAQTVPVTAAGQPVSVMRDKSGAGLHWVAPSDTARPILRQDALGYFYLEFDGSNRTMGATFPALDTGLSLFAAIEWEAQASNQQVVGVDSGASWGRGNLYVRTSTPRYGFGAFTDAAGAVAGGVTTAPEKIVIGGVSSRSGTSSPHRNAQSQSSGSAGTVSVASQAWSLAGTSTGTFARFKGRFYGDAGYSRALASDEVNRVSAYLARRYGDLGAFIAIGDSHTAASYPFRLESDLRTARGSRLAGLNYGISGDSTADMLERQAAFISRGPVHFAVLYGGANDGTYITTVQASPAPTASSFAVASGKGVGFGTGARIFVNGVSATVSNVAGDVLTLSAPLAGAPAAGTSVTLDTQGNLEVMVNALRAAGVSRVLLMDQHFMNWASGGDTLAVERADLAELRAKQAAAASSTGSDLLSLYASFRAKVADGTYAEGNDTAYHTAVGNIHLNETGLQAVADFVEAKLIALGWV